MLFMVIESFKRGDPAPVGERFKICGRMLPDVANVPDAVLDTALALLQRDPAVGDHQCHEQQRPVRLGVAGELGH